MESDDVLSARTRLTHYAAVNVAEDLTISIDYGHYGEGDVDGVRHTRSNDMTDERQWCAFVVCPNSQHFSFAFCVNKLCPYKKVSKIASTSDKCFDFVT